MVDVYSTEPERKAALAEVTALRRQFDTTTAKGAKAFAASKEAQDALKRLDAAKSAAGMRTSAEDLAALNRIATSDTATMTKTADGKMTAAPTKAERAVTKQLNQPSKQYFREVQQTYKNPKLVPTWEPSKTLTPETVEQAKAQGIDLSRARYDWMWYDDASGKNGRWAIGLVGALKTPPNPKDAETSGTYAIDTWYSGKTTLGEAASMQASKWGIPLSWGSYSESRGRNTLANSGKNYRPFGQQIDVNEVAEALPELTYSDFQEIYYRLTLEKDTDITIEDILDKYDEMYGEG
jgi:hypothetical protein